MPAPSSSHALRGRIGGYRRWVNVLDRTAATAPARQAMLDRFEREARAEHPEATDQQIALMAEARRKAYFAMLAQKSAEARRKGGTR